jgi:hypothetical protein
MTRLYSLGGLDADTVAVWRQSWHAMMCTYLPGIDSVLSTIFETVDLVMPAGPLRVLDLGGPCTVTGKVLPGGRRPR